MVQIGQVITIQTPDGGFQHYTVTGTEVLTIIPGNVPIYRLDRLPPRPAPKPRPRYYYMEYDLFEERFE